MVLTQSGQSVSGSISQTAPQWKVSGGAITGTVVGNEFRFQYVNVTDYGGGAVTPTYSATQDSDAIPRPRRAGLVGDNQA